VLYALNKKNTQIQNAQCQQIMRKTKLVGKQSSKYNKGYLLKNV